MTECITREVIALALAEALIRGLPTRETPKMKIPPQAVCLWRGFHKSSCSHFEEEKNERWFERPVKEAINVKVERAECVCVCEGSGWGGVGGEGGFVGGLRHHLSSSYNAVLKTLLDRSTLLLHLPGGGWEEPLEFR